MTGFPSLTSPPSAVPPDLSSLGAQQGIITVLIQLVQALYTVNASIRETFPNWVAVPATAADPGAPGMVAYDATHFYICVATNTWCRVAIATF